MKDKRVYSSKTLYKGRINSGLLDWFMQAIVSFVQQMPNSSHWRVTELHYSQQDVCILPSSKTVKINV